MSFILDALKKSEAERQRKSGPGFADIPDVRRSAGTPPWLWVVAGLLAINLTVLVLLLLRPGTDAEPVARVTPPLEAQAVVPEPGFSDLVSAAKENRREAVPADSPAVAATPAAATRSTYETPAREPEPPRSEPRVDLNSLSTFNQLRAEGVLQLPDLHVDLHVYGDQSADRFVVVNMSRYEEGATLAEGPLVREILQTGIVLEHRGTLFFLPR
ncbi:MAG TPA: general secretion pathway protein GspB [Woeseiaceae bacterium]|nr:general secretion pathway protein GspB [Woeseiaceae bacterium]